MTMSSGTSPGRRARRTGRRAAGRLLVQSLALALVVPMGVAQFAQAADSGGLGRPDAAKSQVSKVEEFDGPGAKKAREQVAQEEKANKAQADQARTEQKAAWPGGGEAKLTLAGGRTGKADPGGVPVTLAPPST
jgi:hypothetical protein